MACIDGEQAFPVYRFRAMWAEDGEQDPKYLWMCKDLPGGRVWNGMESYRMFREPLQSSKLADEAREWWTKIRAATNPMGRLSIAARHPEDCVVTAVFVHDETWCGEWFGHWTFDVGQTDQEALKSFGRFVNRMRRLGDGYCLMGAEDRFRWSGTKAGHPAERTDPPCRCACCKEQGVLRISH